MASPKQSRVDHSASASSGSVRSASVIAPFEDDAAPRAAKRSKMDKLDSLKDKLPLEAFLELQASCNLLDTLADVPSHSGCFWIFLFSPLATLKQEFSDKVDWTFMRWVMKPTENPRDGMVIRFTAGLIKTQHRNLEEAHTELLVNFGVKKSGLKLERITSEEDMRTRMKYLVKYEPKQVRVAYEHGDVPAIVKVRMDEDVEGETTKWCNLTEAFLRD